MQQVAASAERSEFWTFGVHCVGIKNRCRKVDRHHSDKNELGRSDTMPTESEAIERATAWIRKNMKTVTKATATLTRWRVENGFETWAMFNDDDNLKFPINI